MKKLLLILILAMSTVSCELFSKSYWDRVEKSRREEGRRCYKRANGDYYCKDKYGKQDFRDSASFFVFYFLLNKYKKESIIKHTKSPINHYLILVGLLIYFDKP